MRRGKRERERESMKTAGRFQYCSLCQSAIESRAQLLGREREREREKDNKICNAGRRERERERERRVKKRDEVLKT